MPLFQHFVHLGYGVAAKVFAAHILNVNAAAVVLLRFLGHVHHFLAAFALDQIICAQLRLNLYRIIAGQPSVAFVLVLIALRLVYARLAAPGLRQTRRNLIAFGHEPLLPWSGGSYFTLLLGFLLHLV